MQEFLTTLVSFPTFMFTCALAMALLYWMVVIFGALDLDFLDSVLGLDSMDAAVDGALDSIEGVADSAVEGAAESIEGALDANAEGIADGVAEGTAEGVDAAEGDHGGLLAGLLNAMGVRGVPITIVGTFLIFWAWILSYLSTRFLGPLGATVIVGLAIVVTSSFGALFMAAISSRPFRKLFVTQQAQRRASLVGKMCTVLSARVDGDFGRAEIEDGGAGFVAEVRCPQDNGLIRGAQALVYRYEPSEGIFFIGPVDAALTEAAEITEES
ncbi:MAG: hypothetical protein BMS9Abin37_2650 [Acidobacteriota bacterium]|nr:MAG: hypothetical protein BMS9Abin37_2650 [Acidobacteriota bacterium]